MTAFDDEFDDEGGGTSAPLDPAAQAVLDRLETLSLDDLLARGHREMLKQLVAKVELGQASHQELAILRNMLRDNGMVLLNPLPVINGEPVKPTALPKPAVSLPPLPRPDYEDD